MSKIFWSAATGGFYHRDLHDGAVPSDATAISAPRHRELLDAQAKGATITAGNNGRPIVHRPGSRLAERQAIAVRQVKRHARRRIEAIASLARQSNDMALVAVAALDAAEAGYHLPRSEDLKAAIARRACIDAIRAASNAIEEDITALSAAQLADLDIAEDPRWHSEER